jgi:vacuolar-type H+-ATPase subunit I/STV1
VARVSAAMKQQHDDHYEETNKRIFDCMKDIQKRVNKLEDKDEKRDTEIDEMQKQIDHLTQKEKEKDKKRDTEIDELKQHIDDLEQKEKDRYMIVTGLKNDQLDKTNAIKVLNEKLKKNIRNEDVEYVLKLKNVNESQPNRVRVVFYEKAKKNEIVKQKTKLKDTDIWLSDDLTKRRSGLAFAARKAVRDRKINLTWVHDGKVFVKKTESDKPRVITCSDDLPH